MLALITVVAAHATPPDYVLQAVARFSADIPAKMAFTITTERGEAVSVERYDPSKPLVERWTLLRHNGQTPSEKDLAKYAKLKAANPSPVSQASFQKSDIAVPSLKLIREDAERADLEGTFRETSTDSDKMLGHLRLMITVTKKFPYVEKYSLTLIEPYSPILGVKMNQLNAQMEFSPPTKDLPSLPRTFVSDFTGKIFFFGTNEKLKVIYSDFTRVE
ncbi:hypothetical protein [Oleiharenicola lentus]|uniref:hypothetical protein n=1 Tax=Oleiharenicola lentus TaxID=2508720 RepID=UPI003F6765A2